MTPEILAVAAIVLAAAVYLVLLTVKKYRARRAESSCSGCGCGKSIQLTGRNTGQTHQYPR
ncbi:MAG: hypothetical protein WCO94_13885 [Verrucomicrobiota bacterium]